MPEVVLPREALRLLECSVSERPKQSSFDVWHVLVAHEPGQTATEGERRDRWHCGRNTETEVHRFQRLLEQVTVGSVQNASRTYLIDASFDSIVQQIDRVMCFDTDNSAWMVLLHRQNIVQDTSDVLKR